MEKLRFTQLFRESEKELSPEEKLDIILAAYPDKKDEINDDFEDAKFNGKLEDFFADYKDILDNAQNKETTETSEDEEEKNTETTNEGTTEIEVNTSDKEADDEVEVSDAQAEKEQEEAVKDSKIKEDKSNLVITNKYYDKLKEVLGISSEIERDFEKYEEYFGYTSAGKKESVKVMFSTPENWPIKTGDSISKDDPLFHTVSCMNEFLIWRMGVQVYNRNPKIKSILNAVFATDKAGSELNSYVKSQAAETVKELGEAKAEILTGSTMIDDPFETGNEVSQKNNIILFMFTKVFPTILKVAKSGKVGRFGSCTAKVFGKDNLYRKLYQIARGDFDTENTDSLTDLILDSYNAFLGGRVAVRAPYEGEIRGKPLIGNANAMPLCVFDDSWLSNESSDAKNVFKKMDTAFSEKNTKFEIRNTRKTHGVGATKAIGKSASAYADAAMGKTDEELKNEIDLGEKSENDALEVQKARLDVTTVKIEIEPFTVIASTVGTEFMNFLSCMTRVGARKANVFELYGERYWSEEDIENEKNPKKKEQMINDNKLWVDAKTKILNFNPMSINTPISGKDGDVGTVADKIAAPDESTQNDLKISLPSEFDNIIDSVKLTRNKADKDLDSGEDTNLIGRDLFSLLKLEQFLFAGFNWLGYTPVNAWNFTGGYQEKRPEKALMKIKDWCRLALVGEYSTIGGKTDPHFGLGNTDIRDTKQNTLLDSLAEVRGRDGVWFMEKTPEGIKERQKLLKFLEEDYENNFKKLYDFVKTKTKFDSVKEFIDSLGLSGTLWEPKSIMPEDIRTPANLVYQYDKNGNPKVMLKNQDAKLVSNWVRTIFANNPNSKTFDPLVNPKNENFDANKPIVDKVRDVTGIDLYSYFKDGKVDNKGILAALEAWSKLTNNKFNVFSGTEDNLASLSDEKAAQDGDFFRGGSSIIQKNHVIPKNEPEYDKYNLTTTTSPELIRRGKGVTYHDSLELVNFFKDVFREASAKSTPKKQRFTIN